MWPLPAEPSPQTATFLRLKIRNLQKINPKITSSTTPGARKLINAFGGASRNIE
jgi:hypothetical protein